MVYISTSGGHEKWNHPTKPLLRPIVFQTHKKEVSRMIVKNNLNTMDLSMEDLNAFLGR